MISLKTHNILDYVGAILLLVTGAARSHPTERHRKR